MRKLCRILTSGPAIARGTTWLILLTCSLLPRGTDGSALDWSYHSPPHPGEQSRSVQSRSPPVVSETPSPVVLPPASWPESSKADYGGWQLKQPTIGTGRAEAYTDSRTAVRLAEQQQDSALATSTAPPPGFEDLPGVLQGLNYRIDFGIEYRF